MAPGVCCAARARLGAIGGMHGRRESQRLLGNLDTLTFWWDYVVDSRRGVMVDL